MTMMKQSIFVIPEEKTSKPKHKAYEYLLKIKLNLLLRDKGKEKIILIGIFGRNQSLKKAYKLLFPVSKKRF